MCCEDRVPLPVCHAGARLDLSLVEWNQPFVGFIGGLSA